MMMMIMMMMMMMTLMKLVNSGTKFRPGIEQFYQPNSGCVQFQKRGRGYVYIYILCVCVCLYMYIEIDRSIDRSRLDILD